MDQGIVALATAGVGLIGAIGGAAIGGLAAARGARIGAETAARATARQVQDQAAAEHLHWLRERRLEACRDYLALYDEYARAAGTYSRLLDGDQGSIGASELGNMGPATSALLKAYFQIRLLGPDALRQAALQIQRVQQDHFDAMLEWRSAFLAEDDQAVTETRARQEALRSQLVEAHDAFLTAVNRSIAAVAEPGDSAHVSSN